jgi:hypothetical protein
MFIENFKKVLKQHLQIFSGLTYEEKTTCLKGELFLFLRENGALIKTIHQSNIIVNTASILIARLLKDNTEPSSGISFLGVGSGNESWDPFDPPAPTTSQTLLENEFYRKSISTSTFVDPQTAEPTTNHTNIVDYATTFSESEAVGPIMELSLFGGDASTTIDTGTMINWRTFPVINKTNAMTLTIIFRITA